ncbi:MAG: cytochrome o ubiquinol oxidase subunit IV [Verrucomicrobia bacterium]|nr:cytochrome o ubiquinol oxidase subunit IV [Verrucomicrobiota bacterium]
MNFQPQEEMNGSLGFYITGFILCILLTLTAYFIVDKHLLSKSATMFSLVGLGLLQAFVQLVFFLHLGKEPKPKWHQWAFFSMLGVLLILCIGSLWIMYNLDYRLM